MLTDSTLVAWDAVMGNLHGESLRIHSLNRRMGETDGCTSTTYGE